MSEVKTRKRQVKPYAEGRKGIKNYRITKAGPKHFRQELVDGKGTMIKYSASGLIGERNIIALDDADAKKLAHMGLVRTDQVAMPVADESPEPDEDIAEPSIPVEWEKMPAKKLKALASTIIGDDVTKIGDAREIVSQAYADQVDAEDGTDDV